MLTTEELAAIPLFSSLPAADLKNLAKAAADIHLGVGEYAVHEGDEPALYVVLSGKLEIIKLVDGNEQKLGERLRGMVLGEITVIYGTQFQSSGRALERSRVLRLDARQYIAAAAASPEIATAIGNLAHHRISGPKGLQGIAAERRQAKVTMVGQRWDTACLELSRFLSGNKITCDWLMPDDPDLPSRWPGPPPAESDYPAVRLADGTTRSRPQARELARLLGLQTNARKTKYDTVIIGAGPAGLAAAVYAASEGLHTVVVEQEAPGGQAGTSSLIDNYLGFPSGITGDDLANRALRQAQRFGAEILITRKTIRIDPETRDIVLDGGEVLHARTVIIATGVSWRRLALEGFDRLIGKGVYYGAATERRRRHPGSRCAPHRRRKLGGPGRRYPSPTARARSRSSSAARRWKRACPNI